MEADGTVGKSVLSIQLGMSWMSTENAGSKYTRTPEALRNSG
jgi:hypothetical protein